MLSIVAAVAAFTQPPLQIIAAAPRHMPPTMSASGSAPSSRRAAVLGAAAAAALSLPQLAHAELSAERRAEIDAEVKAEFAAKKITIEDEEKKSKFLVTVISGIVLVSPIFGIVGAQKAIATMTEGDEEFKKEFKGNDPTVKFQRNRAFKNKR